MKNLKRILAIVLALVMVIGTMAGGAFANDNLEGTGSIIITAPTGETLDGRSFAIYKIFDANIGTVESSGTTTTNIKYSWNKAVGEGEANKYYLFLKDYNYGTSENVDKVQSTNISDHITKIRTLTTTEAIVNFGEALYQHISKPVTGSGGSSEPYIKADKELPASGNSITFSNLDYGFYLVYETTNLDTDGMTSYMRSAVILTNVDPSSTITMKAINPTITKTVQKASKSADSIISATIGDDITYNLTVRMPDLTAFTKSTDVNGKEFIFTVEDIWDNGITPVADSFKVTYGSGSTATGSSNSVYTVTNTTKDGKSGYLIKFNYAWLKDQPIGSTFVISYDAELNAAATIDDGAANPKAVPNTNIATLTYSRNAMNYDAHATQTSSAKVYTYKLKVNKTNSIGGPLSGAKFKIGRGTEYAILGENNVVTAWTTNSGAATEIVMTSTSFDVVGLGAGTYFLEETFAPEGYSKPAAPITFTIDETFNATELVLQDLLITCDNALVTDAGHEGDAGHVSLTIKNNPVGALPETGGMGTTMFIFGGIMLMAGAAAFLVLKKREAKN